MSTGGIRMNIGQDEKKMAMLEQKLAEQDEDDMPWQLSQIKEGCSSEEISDGDPDKSSSYGSEMMIGDGDNDDSYNQIQRATESDQNRLGRVNTESNLLMFEQCTDSCSPDSRRPLS